MLPLCILENNGEQDSAIHVKFQVGNCHVAVSWETVATSAEKTSGCEEIYSSPHLWQPLESRTLTSLLYIFFSPVTHVLVAVLEGEQVDIEI